MMQALVTRDELLRVPFSRMRLDPDNERIDLGPIEWLTNNIRNEGVKEPLWGYRGVDETKRECYFVVNGSRRFAVLQLIYDGGKGIDIVAPFKTFDPKKVNLEQRIIERLIRNEGLPYSRLEKSSSIGKLSAYGWSNQKIAEQLSMSITWVADTLLLHHAPQRLKNIVSSKELSASLAIEMIKKGEIEAFLTQYSNGHYSQAEEPINGIEIQSMEAPAQTQRFAETSAPTSKRINNKITKRDFNELNSIKEFKNFSKVADPTRMSDSDSRFFLFLCKIMNNELTQLQIAGFFNGDIE